MSGVAAGAAQAAIKVTTTEGAEVARFSSLACRTDSAGFHGRAVVKGWRLVVRIQPFAGFKTYQLEYGENESAASFFLDPPGGGNTFSNTQESPLVSDRLTLGGGIQFPNGRNRIRLAFPITYDSDGDKPNIVRLVGTAKCTYPRKRG
ncbi:hypothetical protein [Capillimicrobium parvum]|uniref:Uncharacterized protein n=1 Tax=Capillimicrobium parvum TaxID=2884022 RepID=A0A9E7C2I9_9ACTN|nr:hypothetical protein [Capillimicrobium parvum]UGS38491.1 hypothetical protein DSM104329_04920 [Capillimicrobium parvum]